MAKYRLKIEGIDDINPTPFEGKIEVYYNTDTNAVEINTPTEQAIITEAEPDLTLGATPSNGDVLTYNSATDKWENKSEITTDKITLNDTAGLTIEKDFIKSKAFVDAQIINPNDWSKPYIEVYDGGMDLYVDNTDLYLTPDTIYVSSNMVEIQGEGSQTLKVNSTGVIISENTGQYTRESLLRNDLLTANRTFQFPNADGTIALTSDITPYVPEDQIEVTGVTPDGFQYTIGSATDIVIPTNTIRNFSVKGVGVGNDGLQAVYTGTPAGCSTPVTLTAVKKGTIGNSIALNGNATLTITQLITNWNASYPTNNLILSSGDGSQVIADKTEVKLDGGTNVYVCATYNIVGTAKNIGGTVSVADVTPTEITDELTIVGMTVTADDSNNSILVRATGKSGTIINWSAKVEWHDITIV